MADHAVVDARSDSVVRAPSKSVVRARSNSAVRARIDEDIRQEAVAVLAAMGLTVSDAFRMMMIRIAREKALPFEPLAPNAETIAAMRDSRTGKLPRFKDVAALMQDLNARD